MNFTDEQKTVNEFNDNYFRFGVHLVKIAEVSLGATEAGKDFIEVTVVDPENAEITDSARSWLTTDAAINYSFNTLRQIFVHNAPEAKKDEARDLFDQIKNSDQLVELMQTLIGKECWFSKLYDPERTYVNQAGDTKRSVNKNVYGYEPKIKPGQMPDEDPSGVVALVDKIMPGAREDNSVPFPSKGDAAATVPEDDDWAK